MSLSIRNIDDPNFFAKLWIDGAWRNAPVSKPVHIPAIGAVVEQVAQGGEAELNAITRANDTPNGLSAYVYSGSYAMAKYIADHLESGIIGFNEMRPLKAQIPLGGWKRSGIGAEGGIEGLYEFLEPRVISPPKTFL